MILLLREIGFFHIRPGMHVELTVTPKSLYLCDLFIADGFVGMVKAKRNNRI